MLAFRLVWVVYLLVPAAGDHSRSLTATAFCGRTTRKYCRDIVFSVVQEFAHRTDHRFHLLMQIFQVADGFVTCMV